MTFHTRPARPSRAVLGLRVRALVFGFVGMVAACGADGAEDVALGAADQAVMDQVGDAALAALQRGDRDTFVLELHDQLAAMQEWAGAFERDIQTAFPEPGPELVASFRRWKTEYGDVKVALRRYAHSDGTAGRALYDRVSQLEAEARRIDDLRSPIREASSSSEPTD